MGVENHDRAGPEVTDAEVEAAMRAFEQFSSVLRYREAEKRHANDFRGMRAALEAAAQARAGEPGVERGRLAWQSEHDRCCELGGKLLRANMALVESTERERDALAMILFVGLCGGEDKAEWMAHVAEVNAHALRMQERAERAKREREEAREASRRLHRRCQDDEASIAALRRMLRRFEWTGMVPDSPGRSVVACPICLGKVTVGHAPDCALAAQIGGPAREGGSDPALIQPTDCRAAPNSDDPAADDDPEEPDFDGPTLALMRGAELLKSLARRTSDPVNAAKLDELRALSAAQDVRVLQGIAKVLGLPDYTDVTAEAVSEAIQGSSSSHPESDANGLAKMPWDRARLSAVAGLCMCHTCVETRGEMQVTLHLCPKCGNKRCPKAENHAFLCTDSNAVGQVGELEDPNPRIAHVARAFRSLPSSRRDLDRMGEAIRALTGSPVVGRAIGDGR